MDFFIFRGKYTPQTELWAITEHEWVGGGGSLFSSLKKKKRAIKSLKDKKGTNAYC